jgi:hypothetical protein
MVLFFKSRANSASSMSHFYDNQGYLTPSDDESDVHILKFPSSVDDIFWAPPVLSSPSDLTPIKSELSRSPTHSLTFGAMHHASYLNEITSYCPTPEWACNTPSSLLARYNYSHPYHTHITDLTLATPHHFYSTHTPSSRHSKKMEPLATNATETPRVRPTLTTITNAEKYAPFSSGSPLTPLPESCFQSPTSDTPHRSSRIILSDDFKSPSPGSEYVATPTPTIPRRGAAISSKNRLPALHIPDDLMKQEEDITLSSDPLLLVQESPLASSSSIHSSHKRSYESADDRESSHKKPKIAAPSSDPSSLLEITDPNAMLPASSSNVHRHFPSDIPINDEFEGFYRRFPLCSFVSEEENGYATFFLFGVPLLTNVVVVFRIS